MSNVALVYNTADAVRVLGSFTPAGSPPVRAIVVCSMPNRVPLPWLFAFQPSDVQLADVRLPPGRGPERLVQYVAMAPRDALLQRVDAVREKLAHYTGHADAAADAARLLAQGLSQLPLPYLCLDAWEVIFGPGDPCPSLKDAIAGARDDLAGLSGYADGVEPYLPSDLFRLRPEEMPDRARLDNAVAMEPNFLTKAYWDEFVAQPAPDTPATPPPAAPIDAPAPPDRRATLRRYLPWVAVAAGVVWGLLSKR